MTNKKDLYPMDCSAIIYPYIATKTVNQSFTMEADLDRDIEPERLKTVVQSLCERFPTMFVRLHTDSKGYSLEHVHDTSCFVMERPDVINEIFDLSENNTNLVRVTYKGNRVGVEVFHSVADGSGGIVLLKSIIAEYYRSLGYDIPGTCGVLLKEDEVKETEIEDSFRTNYEKGRKNASRSGKHAFQYFKNGPFATWHQTELTMPVDEIKAVSKKFGATITEFVSAVYLYSFYKANGENLPKKPISLSVPINLRPIYNSETIRNFSLYFLATVPKKDGKITFEDILANVRKEFAEGTNKDLLSDMITTNVSQNNMPIFLKAPRKLKHIILRFGAEMYGEGLFTSAFSNLGIVKLPEELLEHVKMFRAIIGQSPKNHIKMTAYCYNGIFALMISSRLIDRTIEATMQKLLEEYGINITVDKR